MKRKTIGIILAFTFCIGINLPSAIAAAPESGVVSDGIWQYTAEDGFGDGPDIVLLTLSEVPSVEREIVVAAANYLPFHQPVREELIVPAGTVLTYQPVFSDAVVVLYSSVFQVSELLDPFSAEQTYFTDEDIEYFSEMRSMIDESLDFYDEYNCIHTHTDGLTFIFNEPGLYGVQAVNTVQGSGDIPSSIYTTYAVIKVVGVTIPGEQPSSWAAEQVNAAIAAELVPENLQSGYTQAATRAEFAALAVSLYETVTETIIPTSDNPFTDTNDINAVKAAEIGVTTGTTPSTFNPGGNLTREQAAAMLSRLAAAMDKTLPQQEAAFNDNDDISSWAFDAVGQMQAAEIMGGVGSNTFSPQGPYTREQSIITIMRLYDIVK
ncbi:MAG: S-layer homology domain-containing protein [Oscillospiraceae bacterium]|nr:S-layer homology domain-containing protein [Oscillospiraceae bacterium]